MVDTKRKDRSPVPDLARGLAVLFMILVHLTDYFARREIYEHSVFGTISLFLGAAPAAVVFVTLMGYFIPATQKTPKALFRRGLMLFMGGIALNTARSLHFLWKIWNGTAFLSPLALIFCVDVLPFAGLALMVVALLIRFVAPNYVVYFVLSVAVACVGQYAPDTTGLDPYLQYGLAFLIGRGYAFFPLFPWLAYPLLGIAFWSLQRRWPMLASRNPRFLLASGFATVVSCFAVLPDAVTIITTDEQMDYWHPDLRMFAWCVCFTIAWFVALTFAQGWLGQAKVLRYIRWVGRNVTAFYVFQWLILWNVAPLLYRSQGTPSLLAWFVATLVASSLLTLGWRAVFQMPSQRPTASISSAK